MQLTIYLSDQDKQLLEQLDLKAESERKSRSQMILTIVEQYFAGHERVGQILVDMGKITTDQLNEALKMQKRKEEHRLLGEILIDQGHITERELRRALAIQVKNET